MINGSKVASRGPRLWLLLALALAAAAGLAFVLASGHQQAKPTQAVTSPEYSMQIVGGGEKAPNPGQTPPPTGCNTKTPTDNNCSVPAGTEFTVQVFLNKLNLPELDGDTIAGYGAVQIRLNTTVGLTLKNRNAVEEFGPAQAPFWPDCAIRAENKGVNTYLATCTIGQLTNESTYTGLVMEADYTCGSPGVESKEQVSMVHGVPADTHLVDELGGLVLSNGGATDTITVVCQSGVGGITELPEVEEAPLEAAGSSGTSVGVLAGIAAAAVAGVVALGGAAWYARRQWWGRHG